MVEELERLIRRMLGLVSTKEQASNKSQRMRAQLLLEEIGELRIDLDEKYRGRDHA